MSATLLVIDDNKDIRENSAEILQLAGYATLTAENGRKGVELAIEKKPDLVICDIMMPELDGYGVLHLLRKNPATQHIPLIFLTAKTDRSDFRKGMEMGADDYLTKPFDDLELLNAVETRLKKMEVLKSASAIGERPTFATDADLQEYLLSKFDRVNVPRKSPLYEQGKTPRFVYFVITGKLKAVRQHEEGKDYLTDLFHRGEFIGYAAVMEENAYPESVEALESSELLRIPKEDFLALIYGDAAIANRFMRLAAHNVREKEERLVNLAYSSLRKRVARSLLNISAKLNDAPGAALSGISREEIAQYTGTATESLIRTLGDFRAEKLIEINQGKILIIDPEKLRSLSC